MLNRIPLRHVARWTSLAVALLCILAAGASWFRGYGYGDRDDGATVDCGCVVYYRNFYSGPPADIQRRKLMFPAGNWGWHSWPGDYERTAFSFRVTIYSFSSMPRTWGGPGYDTRWSNADPVVITDRMLIVPLWLPTSISLVVFSLTLWPHVRARVLGRRKGMGYCRSCGYNLYGNTLGRCPECGQACALVPSPHSAIP